MKPLLFLPAIMVGFLLSIAPVMADNCATPVVVRRHVVAPAVVVVNHDVVVTEALIARFVPVVVPSYGAGYYPPPPAPVAQQAQTDPMLIELLKKMDARLQRLEQPQQQATPVAPVVPVMPKVDSQSRTVPGASLVVARCASCHDASTASSKGGSITLTQDGQVVAWSDKVKARTTVAIYRGTMPKGSKMTDDEVSQFVDFVDSQK